MLLLDVPLLVRLQEEFCLSMKRLLSDLCLDLESQYADVAKSLSRLARLARGALRPRCVLVQYGEGPRGEPASRRHVVAADRRLQQKCS